ncbi:MAG: hypothetical protein V2A79_16975 [Planctomycetota bacterium]
MTDPPTLAASGGQRFLPVRLLLMILEAAAWVGDRLVSPRGLGLAFLAVTALSAVSGWIRPPISGDIRGLYIPLFGDSDAGVPGDHLYGLRRFVPLSVGTILLSACGVGAVLVVLKPSRVRVSAGLVLCALLVCQAAVLFNHPDLVEELDRQNTQCESLVTVLQETVQPQLKITFQPRVGRRAPGTREGGLLGMIIYMPTEQLVFLLLALAAVGLAYPGTLHRRLGRMAVWGLAGALLACAASSSRLLAEYSWTQAVDAENHGEVEAAQCHLRTALERFPAFARMRETWEFLGRLDYRRSCLTAASRFFLAAQWARNEQDVRAIAELEALVREGQPTPEIRRWLADALTARALRLFGQGQRYGAEQQWERALAVDPSQEYLRLFLAALAAPVERRDPDRVAALVDPLLRSVGHRALRAALQAMLGDCYFECQRFVEARDRYRKSLKTYSLPKQINYRALRGLLGM